MYVICEFLGMFKNLRRRCCDSVIERVLMVLGIVNVLSRGYKSLGVECRGLRSGGFGSFVTFGCMVGIEGIFL